MITFLTYLPLITVAIFFAPFAYAILAEGKGKAKKPKHLKHRHHAKRHHTRQKHHKHRIA